MILINVNLKDIYIYIYNLFLDFAKVLKRTKNVGFHLMLKTNDLQDKIYSSMDDVISVTINNLYLFIPNLIPSVEIQLMFNEAIEKNYKISYDEIYTKRQVVSDMIVQHDIGSTQQVKSPKYVIRAHQTKDRTNAPDKKLKIAIFDNPDLRKYHVEKDSLRYPRAILLLN